MAEVLKTYFVYILASSLGGTLYVGVTNDIVRRVSEHKAGEGSGFTRRYEVDNLVWFEMHDSIENAIRREKNIKDWKRRWKVSLIEERNPNWDDLYPGLLVAWYPQQA